MNARYVVYQIVSMGVEMANSFSLKLISAFDSSDNAKRHIKELSRERNNEKYVVLYKLALSDGEAFTVK